MANLYLYLKLSFLETYNKNCLKKFARIFRCLSKISKTCFYMIANPHCIWYTKSYVLLSLTRENLIQREGLDSLRIALETKTGTFSSCLRSLHISPEERQPSVRQRFFLMKTTFFLILQKESLLHYCHKVSINMDYA